MLNMENQKEIKIYTVIPYFSNGFEVFTNDVKSFTRYKDAEEYGYEFNRIMGNHFDIVESELGYYKNEEEYD